ncbi:LssY C-terminal domain-containing protein [Clostridium sardiniense]|uniref:LssY C-terminal domain-containing protein n=1 Tax=Clostridium sardiniense TaxID=29369 RepID=A0ABS7KWI1_CLOSR|nr:LssY C-terminal domain-containing protein [Clostridium sardiniense]MBY0755141.1 LssY C-terminal domain-containing protein [Clostridium sardiniense]MDQ0458995.1 hypothetical protein [Clostridium sardiniense]
MKNTGNYQENKLNLILRFFRFIITIFLAILLYEALFSNIFTKKFHTVLYILLWLYISYIILPITIRFITKLYLPDYFIGRTKTNDGLFGDPINIAFLGDKENIIEAFKLNGWHIADNLNLKSSIKIGLASVFSKSYPCAPVSSLFLFTRKQDITFEKEVYGNPRKRHHIRLWETPEEWYLPGGFQADWLASATYDKNIGLSLFTGQVTHKIDSNVDAERDFVIQSLKQKATIENVTIVQHFTSSYHDRNGGGDRIYTDGSLPFVKIKDITNIKIKSIK